MVKKFVLFCLIFLIVGANCFAKRMTRIDKYKNVTLKIVWDDTISSGPDNSNWAIGQETNLWYSVKIYHYIHPDGTADSVYMLTGFDNASYRVFMESRHDGEWTTLYKKNFYSYNAAINTFMEITNDCENILTEYVYIHNMYN